MNRVELRLVDQIDRTNAPKPIRDNCVVRAALEQAWRAYGDRYGRGEAKAWAAARAHYRPGSPANDPKADAEAIFTRGGE